MEILPIGVGFEPAENQRTLGQEAQLDQQDFLQIMVAQLRNQNRWSRRRTRTSSPGSRSSIS